MKPELKDAPAPREFHLRDLTLEDLGAVTELDEELTGESKEAYWSQILASFLTDDGDGFGLCCRAGEDANATLDGFLFGEVRAFEFGSETCGWVFAVGVRPEATRGGVASALVAEARRRFSELGVTTVRTMVRRIDVPLLSFFRRTGFVGGPFVQLELSAAADEDGLSKLEVSA